MRLIQFVFLLAFSSNLFAQQQPGVDFKKITMEVLPIADSKEIVGKGTYDFKLKSKTDSVFIDAINMTFLYVSLNGKKIEYSNSGKKLGFKAPPKTGNHQLFLRYITKPQQTIYFIQKDSSLFTQQIWTQGQGKYTSHWLPSFDDMNEKVELDLTILADEEHVVIANGKLKDKFTEDGITEWNFDMLDPMSSYLAAFVVGNFDKKIIESNSGIPIELYYEPKDSLRVEPTYRHTKEIFDFLEEEIGFPYPWQNYKQVPVQDFLYAGMENTGTTIFSNQYVIDSTAFLDKNYVNVNAHEMAHQWFGNLVTEESGDHHWLHEGFSTYYAYLAERHLFGDDYFYWKLYETAKTLHILSENGDGEALTNPNANSLIFYEKGAWALVMLKDEVGEQAFKKGTKMYLQKHEFRNVTIDDFIVEIETASTQKLGDFREKWLESEEFPWEEVKAKLEKEAASIALMFEMEREFQRIQSDDLDYEAYWNKSKSVFFKQYMISEYHRILPHDIIQKVFASQSIKLRQGLAKALYGVSGARLSTEELALNFETLLEDKSYVTVENALIKLWSNFPDKRGAYLSQTANITGLPNKNIRLLWLTLALITPNYESSNKQDFYKELNGYTASHYNFEVRQSALRYLNEIQALSDESLMNLMKATDHHVWQFKKSSRNLIRELAKNTATKTRLLNITSSMSKEEQLKFQKLINP